MRITIISDLHLKFNETGEDKFRREKVIRFLNNLKDKTDILILNGDIFDLWVSWSKVIIKGYFPILKKLADLNESKIRLIFISGNHDFWFNDFLSDYLHFEIYEDFFSEDIDNRSIFITHGDKYTSNDLRYKIFRSIVRNKIIKSFFKLLHPDFSLSLGNLLSRSSRKRRDSSLLKHKKEKGLLNFAMTNFDKYDIIIMGHSHSPMIKNINNKFYINSGDWLNHNSYIQIMDGTPELKYWNDTGGFNE
jgi:UDP-2,3-diacylglucosamine hydrolase